MTLKKRKITFAISLMKHRDGLYYLIKNNKDGTEYWTNAQTIDSDDPEDFLKALKRLRELKYLKMYAGQEFRRVLDGEKDFLVKYNKEFKHRTHGDHFPQVIYPIKKEDVEAFHQVFVELYNQGKYKN